MTTASFAVFNQAVGGLLAPQAVHAYPAPVVIEQPTPLYRQVTVTPPPPVPSYSNVVHRPHGRSELRGDGVYTAHQRVWIPTIAAVPPAPPPPPRS